MPIRHSTVALCVTSDIAVQTSARIMPNSISTRSANRDLSARDVYAVHPCIPKKNNCWVILLCSRHSGYYTRLRPKAFTA